MGDSRIRRLLEPFRLDLESGQLGQIATYVNLLLHWNRAVNLTAIRDPEQIIIRHFGESMYLKLFRQLRGTLLDVGSGAGFPGLALKIAEPRSLTILLEPVAKKRAFLKEVVRECRLEGVDVRSERVEQFCSERRPALNTMTVRAVGAFESVLSSAIQCLGSDSQLCLWLTRHEGEVLSEKYRRLMGKFQWLSPIPVPLSHEREIWRGAIVSRETFVAGTNPRQA
jgi:16S rRNA (guanine527-N7)-methyltransferase